MKELTEEDRFRLNVDDAITKTKTRIKESEYNLVFFGVNPVQELGIFEKYLNEIDTLERTLTRLQRMKQKYFGE